MSRRFEENWQQELQKPKGPSLVAFALLLFNYDISKNMNPSLSLLLVFAVKNWLLCRLKLGFIKESFILIFLSRVPAAMMQSRNLENCAPFFFCKAALRLHMYELSYQYSALHESLQQSNTQSTSMRTSFCRTDGGLLADHANAFSRCAAVQAGQRCLPVHRPNFHRPAAQCACILLCWHRSSLDKLENVQLRQIILRLYVLSNL